MTLLSHFEHFDNIFTDIKNSILKPKTTDVCHFYWLLMLSGDFCVAVPWLNLLA